MKKTFFNPFEKFTERPLILAGIVATFLLSLSASYFNTRYDGVLDLHFSTPTFFLNTLTDNVINVIILSLCLFTLGKFRNNKTRFIDIFSASLISRIPYYIVPFFNWDNIILNESKKLINSFLNLSPSQTPNFDGVQISVLVLFTGVSLVFLAWYIYLLYQGYKVATNAKGTVNVVLFGITILIAEIFSKIIFYLIN